MMATSAAVERWFASTKPPSEAALRRVRDIILGADPSMRERIQYGITFSSTKSGDFGAFVRYSEPGVNLRLHRGRRLHGRYPQLAGGVAWRMGLRDPAQGERRRGGPGGGGGGVARLGGAGGGSGGGERGWGSWGAPAARGRLRGPRHGPEKGGWVPRTGGPPP